MRLTAALLLLVIIAAPSPRARAGTIGITDYDAYLLLAPPQVAVSDFESAVQTNVGGGRTTIDGVTYEAGAPHRPWNLLNNSLTFPAVSGTHVLAPAAITQTEIHFDGGSVGSIGFWFVMPVGSGGAIFPGEFTFRLFDPRGVETRFNVVRGGQGPGFLGFVSDVGIAAMLIEPVPNDFGVSFNYALDDVTHSAVTPGLMPIARIGAPIAPAPTSLVLLGSGGVLAGLAGLARRFLFAAAA